MPKSTTGLDANKKTPGRKRGLVVDVVGLIVGVVVLAAFAHDNAGTALLTQAAERRGNCLEKTLVDQGFKGETVIHGALLGITVETVHRNPADKAERVRPAAEAVGSRAGQRHPDAPRRLVRECDHRPHNSASRISWRPPRT